MNKGLKRVLVIGSGPIIIGQAAEFDYSGTQACKVLKEEGIEVILVNPNPATIQTDPEFADKVLFEPLTAENIARILIEYLCDAVLGNVSGQAGLNIVVELYNAGFFRLNNIQVLGTQPEDIAKAEDRELFSSTMMSINEPIAPWKIYTSVSDLEEFRDPKKFPVVVRASFTLGGSGGGLARNYLELLEISNIALQQSKIIIEKSLEGEEEFEFELLRDIEDNCVVVCSMENIDPMGVHTGDSIVVSPSQTLSDRNYQRLRNAAIKIVRTLKVIGACNIQFSWNRRSEEYHVIEVNPRTSRSSALASKATGYPIARFSTKLSIGYLLEEIINPVTGLSYAAFEPAMDYVAVKIPVWPFDKFRTKNRGLGISMHSTGEAMGLGRTFEEAFMKAFYSAGLSINMDVKSPERLLKQATDRRIIAVLSALEKGIKVQKIAQLTHWNSFFIRKLNNIIAAKIELSKSGLRALKKAKMVGIGDEDISKIINVKEDEVRALRIEQGIKALYKAIDTCAGEYNAVTPYYYSTYHGIENEALPLHRSVIVLGSGPIRIGQGVEFDYSSVHAIEELKAQKYRAIMINNNPETVSTDFDMSDRLYFEPLNFEYVANVIENDKPEGVLIQFGGQTAISVGMEIAEYFGKEIIKGTDIENIVTAENRTMFSEYLDRFHIKKAPGYLCNSKTELLKNAAEIGFPVLIRPSYIIGGAGIEVFYRIGELVKYLTLDNIDYSEPVLVEKFIENAVELDVDVLSDTKKVLIMGVIEHIEDAGIHSGDAIMVYPAITVTERELEKIESIVREITGALKIRGLINYQLMLKDGEIYMIEANPRASRTVPFLSKIRNLKFARLGTSLMLGQELGEIQNLSDKGYYVKVPVFPFKRFSGIDYLLGPEMKSTGEVIGKGTDFEEALAKAFESSPYPLPKKGSVLLTLNDKDKKWGVKLARILYDLNFEIYATRGTMRTLKLENIDSKSAYKISDVRSPTCYDLIKDHRVNLVINTPKHSYSSFHDGYMIRKSAIDFNVPLFTNMKSAYYAILAIKYFHEHYRPQ